MCGRIPWLLVVAVAVANTADAAIMGKGFLSRGQSSRDSHKPWDGSDRRMAGGGVNANGDKFVYMHHDGSIMEEPPGGFGPNSEQDAARKQPCVGLCYYLKLLALENKKSEEPEADSSDAPNNDNSENVDENHQQGYSTIEELYFDEINTPRPCVGICHYYRLLGIPNPYEDHYRK